MSKGWKAKANESRFECCHQCVAPKRHVGCHSTCEDYAKAKTELEEDKTKRIEYMKEAKQKRPILSNRDFDKLA